MKRKSISFLIPLALVSVVLTSCKEEHVFVNPLDTSNFYNTYAYSQNLEEDGIKANLSNEDPKSYDDTINLDRFIFKGEENVPNITKDKIVIENTIRSDVEKTNGGYKIVSLGDSFLKDSNRKEVVLPKYLERIGSHAFENTSLLSTLNIDKLENLDYVGSYAFKDNAWYHNYYEAQKEGPVIFGNTLYAYKGNVTNYIIPSEVKYIAAEAFKGHSELTSVTFHKGIEEIGDSAFEGTSLVELNLPSSLKKLGKEAFASVPLNSIVIDSSKEERSYGAYVFKNCNVVKSIEFDGSVKLDNLGLGFDNLTSIKVNGERLVSGSLSKATNVKSLDLKNVKYIEEGNFNNLISLETLTDFDDLEYIEDSGITATKYYKDLSDGPVSLGKFFLGFKGAQTEVSLPNDLCGIGPEAMKDYAYELSSLPESLKYIGASAFQNVVSLKKIILKNSIFIDTLAFANCRNVSEIFVNDYTKLGKLVFKGCSKATKLALPYADDLSELFDTNVDVVSYRFMDGPTSIANKMFEKFYSLTEVTFSNTIEDIGVKAFRKCTSLKKVHFLSNIQTIKSFAFQDCKNLEEVTFETVKSINPTTKRIVYKGVRELGAYVFDECVGLNEEFILPRSIRKVNGCFVSRTNVKHITIEVLDYYLEGVVNKNDIDIVNDQYWIKFSRDWNNDLQTEDKYGNPGLIPYTIKVVETK